ncbi:MAG: hypothetical protein O2951_12085 [Bacteroidetes bacterium]|nr:hypothetical protein [Bacteroidota bacterium]
MKNLKLLLIASIIIISCKPNKIELRDAKCTPEKVKPGESVLFSVNVNDPKGQVETITTRLVQYPDLVLMLNDNGGQGDVVEGDGIWSIVFEMPSQASPRQYDWEFRAYDDADKRISAPEGEELRMQASFEFFSK